VNNDTYTPPNGYKIHDNFYVDITETSNINWKEYHHWTGRIFGKNSTEYIEATPDTTVWMGETMYDSTLMVDYYRDYKYDDFPVVGITQTQAMKFSKWRSDRVFEGMLIVAKKINNTTLEQDENTYFTIEKYLSGNFWGYPADTTMAFIPQYRLPAKDEVKEIAASAIANFNAYITNCKSKLCKKCNTLETISNSKLNHSENYELYGSPTRSTKIDCRDESFLDVHNFIGNVAEWTMGYSEIYGGSWNDEFSDDSSTTTIFTENTKSCFIGFRNVCILKPVNEITY
jgi:hypothetical protein